jgi:Xaa-Pro aminopeptidase
MSIQVNIDRDLEDIAEYAARQDVAKSVAANSLAHAILDDILAFIRPGCRESEVKNHVFELYEAHAIKRPWHAPYIRFGENTLLTFQDKAQDDRILGDADIAFADIGIVKDGIEGDAGRTIAFGSNQVLQDLVEASQDIFGETADYWKRTDPRGEALYAFARAAAQRRNFIFNLDPAGHLIGTFPHKGWKRGLNHFPARVEAGLWVLEIQLRHPQLPYGAFYEALLY